MPAADEPVDRRETLRRLVDAVLSLPEPYQGTVWQRWFEQRMPAAGPDGGWLERELCRRLPGLDVRMPMVPGPEPEVVPAGEYLFLWRHGSGALQHREIAVHAGQETVLDPRSVAGR